MKKLLMMLLALIMIVSMVACGKTSQTDASNTKSTETNSVTSAAAATSEKSVTTTATTAAAESSTPVGSTADSADQATTRIVKDMWGREVTIPAKVKSIVCLGSGAPRLAAYLNAMDMLVGAEDYVQKGVNIRRDYNPIHHAALVKLPFVGPGGGSGQNNAYPEEIIKAAPDVILAGYDLEAADELQTQTGIPVVSVRHTTGLAPKSFYEAMRVFAEVIGAQARCEELLSYVDSLKEDLNTRTAKVPDDKKLKAYAGAVTWNGRRGFAGTYSEFGIFNAINAINVAKNSAVEGFYEADFESILTWDPDVVFLDPGNMDLVNEEYGTNPDFFNSLRAIKEDRVYSMPSFNNAGTNFTYAFMDAYYAGIILFPEQFADVDIATKSAEILTTFLGQNTFEQMAEGGLYYGKIKIGE